MIATRHLPLVCVLVGLALIPTFIHSYAGVVVTDTRSTAAIGSSLAGLTSTPSGRNPTWGKRRFNSDDWIERRYVGFGDELVLTVLRSDDLKALYHHPELAVAYGTSLPEYETRRFARYPAIPVHVLRSNPGGSAAAMYVLHYEDGFIEHPLWFQIRTAGELLIGGRRLMTLFFVQDLSVPEEADLETLSATALLFAAIDSFLGGAPVPREAH